MALTTDDFIARCRAVHGDRYDYSRTTYEHSHKKVTITCRLHGQFEQRPFSHVNGKSGCPQCNPRSLKNTEWFISKARQKHGVLYGYNSVIYVGQKIKVTIECAFHGLFDQRPDQHLRGQHCPECANVAKSKDTLRFVAEAIDVHGSRYDYSMVQYLNAYTNVCIGCTKHGVFSQRPYAHLNGQQGCPICPTIISSPEKAYLDQIGIPEHDRQVPVTIDGRRYKIDGADRERKIAYEFNGDFWHGNPAIYPQDAINPISGKTFGYHYNRTVTKQKCLERAGWTVISVWQSELKHK